MNRTAPVDGLSLAYDRSGTPGATPVVALHGWPGDRHDWREVAAALAAVTSDAPAVELIAPDLRGFGESDKPDGDPAVIYSAAGQAASVLGLIDELGLGPVVLAGYDVGSRVAQLIARTAPDRVRALVISPPVPGAGRRVLEPSSQAEFWYQSFHRLTLAQQLVDGRPEAVRAYLEHFWSHWSGPGFTPDPDQLDRLAGLYGAPGAFTASIGWYRAGSGMVASSLAEAEREPDPADRLTTPTTVLWPDHDPLFPRAWSDHLDDFFAQVTVEPLDGPGHFTPLEAPERFVAAITRAV